MHTGKTMKVHMCYRKHDENDGLVLRCSIYGTLNQQAYYTDCRDKIARVHIYIYMLLLFMKTRILHVKDKQTRRSERLDAYIYI
jgi:hypothetical protein